MESLSTPILRSLCNAKGMSCRKQDGGFLSRSQLLNKVGGAPPASKYDNMPATEVLRLTHDQIIESGYEMYDTNMPNYDEVVGHTLKQWNDNNPKRKIFPPY